MTIYLAVLSRYHSYLNSAKHILHSYNGAEPFASFLKKYFSANKKYGSKDRKHIGHLCYCFLRLGKAVMNVSFEEKILIALFLCPDKRNEILGALKPEWNDKHDLPINEKLLIINYSLLIPEIFPWQDELSEGIEHEEFCKSFLVQPDLFLRLRPGKEKIVVEKLEGAGIHFKKISETCLALPNASKLDEIIELDRDAVIQDYSSQITGNFIRPDPDVYRDVNRIPIATGTEISIWDCCAGSGGKSIMVYDIDPTISLTVSDVRESILSNLKKRFHNAGINHYQSFLADLTHSTPDSYPNTTHLPIAIGTPLTTHNYNCIIADVPCTGSGTWSRTPEQLYFFDERKIEKFAILQKKIVSNVIPQLQQGGTFIYITCSVFKKENEEVVAFIKEKFHLQLAQMRVLKGYDKKADTMFIAVLRLAKD